MNTFGRHSSFHLGFKNWVNALKRTKRETQKDNLGFLSAGVAFFVFLGLFPLLAALISIYGLVASPEDIVAAMENVKGVVPEDILSIMEGQLNRLAGGSGIASTAAIVSLLAALWSGSKAIKGMMNALAIINGREDGRHFLVRTAVALGLTLGFVVFSGVCVFLLAILPALAYWLKLSGAALILVEVARWALMGIAVAFGLAVLYHFGPDRRGRAFRWLTPGALTATIIWLGVSGLFSWFVANFGNYNKTYGSLGAIAVLMLWLSLSAYVFIIGAELDVELDREKGLKP